MEFVINNKNKPSIMKHYIKNFGQFRVNEQSWVEGSAEIAQIKKEAGENKEKRLLADKSRTYEEEIRYVDPNDTGGMDIKFTGRGGAYIEENGKYYRLKFNKS
jgi:hypothetical protein